MRRVFKDGGKNEKYVQKKIEQFLVSNDTPMIGRMNAFIACVMHIEPESLSEDEWHKAWGRVQFFLEIVHQVEWK